MGQSYRDLIAWQRAMALVTSIYTVTKTSPREETYGLARQLRRAAVSVPSNIAEGQARYSSREFHHFLSQARGSLVEIETQIMIAAELGYLNKDTCQNVLNDTAGLGRILNRLIGSIRDAA
ncbi:MAG TPA: four helix bundle protein [Terriglobales bacterium]|nr:four helix bundle protein [Terriglobales bacterium]